MDLVCPFDRFIFVADDASSRTSDERRAIRIGPSDGACFDPRRRGLFFCVMALPRRSGQVTVSACTSIGTQYVGELGGPQRDRTARHNCLFGSGRTLRGRLYSRCWKRTWKLRSSAVTMSWSPFPENTTFASSAARSI